MDHLQTVLRLHEGGDWNFALPHNASSLGTSSAVKGFPTSYTTAQLALLLVPSSVLLLLCPFRLFKLRRENLKVLPNRTGALKAVCMQTMMMLEIPFR
jgi:hypothetical protein